MATRDQIQRIRQQTAQAVRSFEDTFKEIDRLAEANAPDEQINKVIRESGIPDDAFVDAYTRYRDSGGVVDFGVGRSLLQGLTFGFADELEAMLPSAVTGLEGDYEQRVGQIRAGQRAFEGREPSTAMAAEMVGALPTLAIPALGAGRVAQIGARAPSLARTMAAGSGIGAAEGILGAAGRSEGMEDFTGRALVEGGLGAGLGALAPPVVAGTSRLMRGGRPVEQQATSQMARIFPEEQMPQTQQAVQQRIEAGDQTPLTLADIGGVEAARELRGLRGAQPEVQEMTDEFLRERTRTQGPRIEQQIETGAGVSPEESVVLGNVVQKQESAAAPLYRQLRENTPLVSLKGLESTLEKPAFRENYQRAINALANRAGRDIDPEILRDIPSLDDLLVRVRRGEEVFVPFDFLDQMKRTIGSRGRGLMKDDADLASQYFNVADDVRDFTDAKVPDYKKAREVFAGEAEVARSMDLGREFDKKTPAEIRELMKSMSESEKRAFLSGAVDSIRMKIGTTRRDRDLMTALNLDAPFQEQRLAAIMGGEDSPAFKAFMDAVKAEGRMAQTRGIVAGGSQTAAFQRDIDRSGVGFDEVVELLMSPSSITNVGTLTRMFQKTLNALKGTGGDVGQRVATRLLETDPRRQMDYLRQVDALRQQARNTARNVQAAGLVGAGAAGQIPSLLDAGE